MEQFREKVNTIFSDTVMIALALLIIPVILVQHFIPLTPTQKILVSIVDWGIWIGFFLEFTLKLIVAERRIKWLTDNWFDSIVSVVVIISPILENLSTIFFATPILRLARLSRLSRLSRLTRLTRFLRFLRLLVLGGKIKRSWSKVNLKTYAAFFFVLGAGFVASFITTGIKHSPVDTTWISLFVSIFGVFYAVLISFFVIHVWGKFNSISGEIGKEVNSLRNVYIMAKQLPSKTTLTILISILNDYIDEVVSALWSNQTDSKTTNDKFLRLVDLFNDTELRTKADEIILNNIIQELRTSSIAQANLINLANDKTPKILWILLILLSTVLVGSFIFLGFSNQLVATTLITLVSTVTALVVALIFDIDTPFKAGFWNISPAPYLELKEFSKEDL